MKIPYIWASKAERRQLPLNTFPGLPKAEEQVGKSDGALWEGKAGRGEREKKIALDL